MVLLTERSALNCYRFFIRYQSLKRLNLLASPSYAPQRAIARLFELCGFLLWIYPLSVAVSSAYSGSLATDQTVF